MSFHFEADFKDGTTYIQGSDNKSIDTKGKNAFYDILQRQDEVVRFHLIDDEEYDMRYTVDLTDGHFEIDGVPFFVHDRDIQDPFLLPSGKRGLIFYQVTHQHQTSSAKTGKVLEERTVVHKYCIGWRTIDQTPGVKRVIAVG